MPLPPPRLVVPAVLALAAFLLTPPAGAQADRRGRTSPGLVLHTGAPTGECTALAFTADGRELLAAGLDKVIHVWPVESGRPTGGPPALHLDERAGRTLRWPIFREQRGSIYTLALSPNDGQHRVAVGGYGYKTGLLAVLDRTTGRTVQLLDDVAEASAVRAAAFDPSGDHVVYGTDSGSLWLWDVRPGQRTKPRRLRPPGRELNPVRLVAFLGPARCLTVGRDGAVQEWDLGDVLAAGGAERAADEPKPRGRFEGTELFAVAISPDGRRLAAAYERTAFRRTLELLELDDNGPSRFLAEQPGQYAHCLAFDATGERLAVGCRVVPANAPFFREAAGQVYVYDLRRRPAPRQPGPRLSYRPAAVAFHPTQSRVLATAGGDDHEVRLWDLDALQRDPGAKPVSELRGPGACLWGVRFDAADPRYIGFQERRAADPPGPNGWGAGDYRVFDLERCDQGLRRAEPFRPEPVIETDGGWTVRPTGDARLWEVVDAAGRAFPLDRRAGYDADLDGFPRCYAFLKRRGDRPTRLAVGHNWGVSLFELHPDGPRLARLMIGHAGEVMSLAVSLDQKTLVTASRDQTLCGWSLIDWPAHPELGARFKADRGRLVVDRLDPGGPAWEVGLQQGDELLVLLQGGPGGAVVYNPEGRDLAKRHGVAIPPGLAVRTLAAAEAGEALRTGVKPNDVLFLVWRRDGKELHEQVRVWQRPVWRLFPTRAERGGEFVAWSYRDFYYHTNSPQADEYVGWHVNAADGAADPTPAFHRLRQFERLKDRAKVRELLQTFARPPERVIIAAIEPPEVRLEYAGAPRPGEAVRLRAAAEPRGDGAFAELESAQLWVNDYLLRPVPLTGGRLPETVLDVPPEKLRAGPNTLMLRCFNKGAVFADKSLELSTAAARPGRPRLLGLCVGVGDYAALNAARAAPPFEPVASATADAEEVGALLGRQRGGPLFGDEVDVSVLTGRAATRAEVLRRLGQLGRAGPDDWLVVFLAGRGDLGASPKFACHDGLLDLSELRQGLTALPGRKLVLLDVRPAGGGPAEGDPVRALTAGLPLMTFAACRPGEQAADEDGHGLFVQTLRDALGDHFAEADQDGDGFLSAAELARFLRLRVPARYQEIRNRLGATALAGGQNPIFYRDPLNALPLLARR